MVGSIFKPEKHFVFVDEMRTGPGYGKKRHSLRELSFQILPEFSISVFVGLQINLVKSV